MSIKNKKLHDVQLDRYNHKEEKKEYCKKNQFVENIIPRKQQKYENKRIDITSNNYPFEKGLKIGEFIYSYLFNLHNNMIYRNN